ncbi:hypothetical protein J6590_051033 [Homalodisca vitripennis]|nr:hypothetical protein J6590_051033 [Homalodisca vitripennis]
MIEGPTGLQASAIVIEGLSRKYPIFNDYSLSTSQLLLSDSAYILLHASRSTDELMEILKVDFATCFSK